jgi:DNA repair protein RecN (Recombination protein N)
MNKVASGGELSRLMLCIKSLIAKKTALPTIIFDEIDTGISGEIALKVGAIMEQMAQSMQVITITHLPQIASKKGKHFRVLKMRLENKRAQVLKPYTIMNAYWKWLKCSVANKQVQPLWSMRKSS